MELPTELVGRELLAQLGERLREERRRRGLTLNQLAQQTGVTTGFLSQLERGKNSPSLLTLWRITDALQVPLGQLFTAGADPHADRYIVRNGSQRVQIPGWQQSLYRLAATEELPFAAHLNIFPPGFATSESPGRHNGTEWLYVLQGTVELQLNGVAYTLTPHDSASFPSSVPHRLTNVGGEDAHVI